MNTKVYQVRKMIGGLNVMEGEGELLPIFTPNCLNVEFRNNEIWSSKGKSKIGSSLNDNPTGIFEYRKFDGSIYLIVHTGTKVYKYEDADWTDITGTALSGSSSDLISAVTFTDLYIFTNGIDNIRKWDGSGNTSDLTCPYKAKYMKVYKNKLILAYTTESGETCPQRVRWSNEGDPESWDANDYIDIVEGSDYITGLEVLGDYLVVFTSRNIHILSHTAGSFPSREEMVAGSADKGCVAPFSIANIGGGIIYLGDNGVYLFNGGISKNITENTIKDIITSLDVGYRKYAYGKILPALHQYWLSVPYYSGDISYTNGQNNCVLIYDYLKGNWTIRDMKAKVFSRVQQYSSITIGDLIGTIGDLEGRIGDFASFGGIYNYAGGYDNDVCKLNDTEQYNGTDFTRYWVSPWISFDRPDINKTVLRLQVFYHNMGSEYDGETLSIQVGKDFKDTYELTKNVSLYDSSGNEILYPNVDFKETGRYFRVKFSATKPFKIQKMLWYFHEKGNK